MHSLLSIASLICVSCLSAVALAQSAPASEPAPAQPSPAASASPGGVAAPAAEPASAPPADAGSELPPFFQRPGPPAPDPQPLKGLPVPTADPLGPRSMPADGPEQPDRYTLVGANDAPAAACQAGGPVGFAPSDQAAFVIGTGGYLRLTGQAGEADRDAPEIGRNDGFAIADARLSVRGRFREALVTKLSLEAALPSGDVLNSPLSSLRVGLKDAYVSFTGVEGLVLTAGHFKPPFDSEQLTDTTERLFIRAALESLGVLPGQGYQNREHRPFATGRQLGVMASSDEVALGDGLGLLFALAVTNGVGEVSGNDNDLPAAFGRLTFLVRPGGARPLSDAEGPLTIAPMEGLQLGLSGFVNPRREGLLPDLYDELDFGGGLDATLFLGGFDLGAQAVTRVTTFATAGASRNLALGGHLQAGYTHESGLGFGYRLALLDPTDQGGVADRLSQHTLVLRWIGREWPVRAMLEYTHALEQDVLAPWGAQQYHNNRLEALLQVAY